MNDPLPAQEHTITEREERPLVLSLFPGIGLLDRGFEETGFCVVRGPDLIFGGDIKRFSAPEHRFDGIIGGPPCQRFSRLAALVKHNGFKLAEDLIPEFARITNEVQPHWFLMENVPAAPAPETPGYWQEPVLFNNRWLGEAQNRVRRFTFGTRDLESAQAFAFALRSEDVGIENPTWIPTVCASGTIWHPTRKGPAGKKNKSVLKEHIKAQGLPESFELPGFTVVGAIRAVGNGVPIPLARAVARAVKAALECRRGLSTKGQER